MLTKKQKKLLISTSIVATLGAATISPIAIATAQNLNERSLLNQQQTRAISNSGFAINNDNTVSLASKGASAVQGLNVNINNPNIAKGVPNGYVFPVGTNGEKNILTCVANDDPNKVLWYSDFGANTEILATEYFPSTNDKLLVLYRDGGSNFNNGISNNTTATIKLRIISNISNLSDGSSQNGQDTTITSYEYIDGDSQRADLWTFVPVLYYTDASAEILVFNKYFGNTTGDYNVVYRVSVSDGTVTKSPILNWSYQNIYRSVILGATVTRYDGRYWLLTAKAVQGTSTDKIVTDLVEIDFDNNKSTARGTVDVLDNVRWFSSAYKWNYLSNAKNSITQGGMYYNPDVKTQTGTGYNLASSFVINASGQHPASGSDDLPYRAPFILNVWWWDNHYEMYDQNPDSPAKIVSVANKPLFTNSSSISYADANELWSAQFNNAPIINSGLEYTFGKGGSSLVGFGYSGSLKTGDYNGLFTFTLKDATATNSGNVLVNNDTNNDYLKAYSFGTGSKFSQDSNLWQYVMPTNQNELIGLTSAGDNMSYYLGQNGLPILQYDAVNLVNPFTTNILQVANGSNKAIIINQNDRAQKLAANAKYGYYSTLSTNSVEIGIENYHLADVTADDLIQRLNLNQVYSQTKLAQDNPELFKNFRVDAIVTIKPDSLTKDFSNGSATIDIYATNRFTDTGEFNYTASLSNLQNNYWNNHKIGTLTLTGFENFFTSTRSPISIGKDMLPSDWYEQNKDNINAAAAQLLFDNKDVAFSGLPTDFTVDNIIVSEVVFDNKAGTVTITRQLNNFYFQNPDGTITHRRDNSTKVQTETTGWKSQQPTNVNSSADIGLSDQLPGNYWTSESDNAKLVQFLFDNKDQVFTNYPDDLAASNIAIVSVTTDNVNGNMNVTLTLNNYYDADGVLQTTTSEEFTIQITNWKSQSGTKYTVTTPQAIGDSSVLPTDFASQTGALQKLIFDNISTMFSNLPDGMSQDNVVIGSITSTNNLTGELQATFTINKYWSAEGVLTNDNEFGSLNITITRFKTQKPTVLPNANASFNFGDNTKVPADFYNNQVSNLQDLIFKNKDQVFENLPTDFAAINIVIEPSNVQLDNLNGTITLTLSLNNYWNAQGVLTTNQNSESRTITITNFLTRTGTVFPEQNAEYDFGVSEQVPTEFFAGQNSTNIKNLMNTNKDTIFKNLPENFSASNINITNVVPNNIDGTIEVTFTLNNWYNNQGDQVSTNSQTCTIKINGFKTQNPTSLKTESVALGDNSIRPSDFAQQSNVNATLQNLIGTNQNDIFDNIPTGFVGGNVFIQSVVPYNNNGTIEVTFTLNNFYNAQGVLQTTGQSDPFTLTITGYKVDDTSTTITGGKLDKVNSIYATDWQDNESLIKRAIVDGGFISNLFNSNISTEDISITVTDADNAWGRAKITVTINNSKAQQNGEVQSSFTLEPVEFTGFKVDKTLTTTIFNGGQVQDFENTLAQEIDPNDETFKQQVIALIQYGVSSETITPADIEVEIVSFNNMNGSMVVNLTINNSKSWTDGVVKESQTFVSKTLTGFKIQLPTQINTAANDTVQVSGQRDQTIESVIDNNQLANIVDGIGANKLFKPNTISSEPATTYSFSRYEMTDSQKNKGQATIYINVENYFDENGVLQKGPKEFSFVISGFKNIYTLTGINNWKWQWTLWIVLASVTGLSLLILAIIVIRKRY